MNIIILIVIFKRKTQVQNMFILFRKGMYVDYILSTVKFHITLSLFFETSYSNINMIKVLSPRYKVEKFCSFEDPEKLLFFYFQKQN